MKHKSVWLAFAFCTFAGHAVRAQGGPPMITDDPGTPGNGHFEINIATTLERRPHEQSWGLPALDLNYGLGERIQLTLQTSFIVLKRSAHGPIGGWGETEAAVKWRFLDEKTNGFSVSTFPRVIFHVLHSSVRRGLVELADGWSLLQAGLQLPPQPYTPAHRQATLRTDPSGRPTTVCARPLT